MTTAQSPPAGSGGRLPLWAGRFLALVGIALAAVNLRTAVTAVSPIAREISVDIPLGNPQLSLIGMVPPIAFALAGIFGAVLARKFGLEGFLVLAILAMVAGHLTRAFATDFPVFLLGSVTVLLGLGVGNVLLPPLVKRYFPDRIGLITAGYVTLISLGTAAPAALAAPVAHWAGWRVSLGMWALVALAALLPWLGILLSRRRAKAARSADEVTDLPEPSALAGRIWHSRTAWLVASVFSVTSFNAYSMFAWLPEMLVQTAGQTSVGAGTLLGYFAILGVPFALLAPMLAARIKNVGLIIQAGALFVVLANTGLLLAPAAAPWLWVTFAGCGQLIFPVCIVLINLRSRSHLGSVALSGFAQGVGYTLAATGPLVIGFIFEWTGSWAGGYLLLIASALVAVVGGYLLRKPRLIEDDLQLHAERVS